MIRAVINSPSFIRGIRLDSSDQTASTTSRDTTIFQLYSHHLDLPPRLLFHVLAALLVEAAADMRF